MGVETTQPTISMEYHWGETKHLKMNIGGEKETLVAYALCKSQILRRNFD